MYTAAFLLINPISFRTVVCIAIHFGMEQNSVIKIFGKQIENDPINLYKMAYYYYNLLKNI